MPFMSSSTQKALKWKRRWHCPHCICKQISDILYCSGTGMNNNLLKWQCNCMLSYSNSTHWHLSYGHLFNNDNDFYWKNIFPDPFLSCFVVKSSNSNLLWINNMMITWHTLKHIGTNTHLFKDQLNQWIQLSTLFSSATSHPHFGQESIRCSENRKLSHFFYLASIFCSFW